MLSRFDVRILSVSAALCCLLQATIRIQARLCGRREAGRRVSEVGWRHPAGYVFEPSNESSSTRRGTHGRRGALVNQREEVRRAHRVESIWRRLFFVLTVRISKLLV